MQAVPIDNIHAGMKYDYDNIIYHTKKTDDDLHIWVEKYNPLTKYPIIVNVKIVNSNSGLYRYIKLPKSVYKKDKKCMINGIEYTMVGFENIDNIAYYSNLYCTNKASYSCVI